MLRDGMVRMSKSMGQREQKKRMIMGKKESS